MAYTDVGEEELADDETFRHATTLLGFSERLVEKPHENDSLNVSFFRFLAKLLSVYPLLTMSKDIGRHWHTLDIDITWFQKILTIAALSYKVLAMLAYLFLLVMLPVTFIFNAIIVAGQEFCKLCSTFVVDDSSATAIGFVMRVIVLICSIFFWMFFCPFEGASNLWGGLRKDNECGGWTYFCQFIQILLSLAFIATILYFTAPLIIAMTSSIVGFCLLQGALATFASTIGLGSILHILGHYFVSGINQVHHVFSGSLINVEGVELATAGAMAIVSVEKIAFTLDDAAGEVREKLEHWSRPTA